MRALEGVRVLDFSRVLAGPLCTMILGDLGADVIKVEHPRTGDDTRAWGPPFVGDAAAYFLCLNRNKRSVTLDLSTEDGRQAAQTLAARSDVLVENFRPGLMERFGLDYDTLQPTNPRLVYCSLRAFREGGDDARPGYDIIVQALSGLMSVTGPATASRSRSVWPSWRGSRASTPPSASWPPSRGGSGPARASVWRSHCSLPAWPRW